VQMVEIGDESKLSEVNIGDVVQFEVTRPDSDTQPPKSQCRLGRYLGYLGIENGEQFTFAFEALPSLVYRSGVDTLTISVCANQTPITS
jgi:hypothetical protein